MSHETQEEEAVEEGASHACTCPGGCVLHEGLGEKSNFLFFAGRPPAGSKQPPIKVVRSLLLDEVLCSNRVSQMTKTYNDIEAVTRLLEEKEKDVELSARIGKELLTKNTRLESTVSALEAELKAANEKLTQLQHELLKKTELIQILTNDVDDSGSEGGTPTTLRSINLDLMQRRIGSLEDENRLLRREASQLARDTTDCEEAEARLVQDIASQLASANMEVDGLADELDRVKDESRKATEEAELLSTRLATSDARLATALREATELAALLQVTRESQASLATELADLKDRHNEVLSLLRDAQEQLRRQRRRGLPTARGGSLFPSLSATAQPDSLASELESSLYSEMSLDSGLGGPASAPYRKVFETVRCASRASSSSGGSPIHQLRGGTTLTCSSTVSGPRMSPYVGPTTQNRVSSCGSQLSFPSFDSVGMSDSECSMVIDSDDSYPGVSRAGVPGVPGAADLEAALRRLTPAEVLARRAALSSGSYPDDGPQTPPMYLPFGCRTPDSIMSTGSSGYSGQSGGWRIPEKLQIVKPLEGSLTLAAWSQLATPTLGGLLDERPGVKIRGGRPLEELGLEMYSLSDLEEDEEDVNPGKSFQSTGAVYTYTTSTVLHPDDGTSVTHSLCTSRVSSQVPTATHTPSVLSRRGSTSTFSTTLGLAKMLNERGIKAVTPSAVATPCGDRSFSPTATPYNSPDGTPPSSPPPYNPLKFPGFLSSGADLLRRTLTGESERSKAARKTKRSKLSLSRSDRKALTSIRLVEKLESFGLQTIMSTTASMSPLTLQGALYSRRSMKSPMTQLTSLKGTIPSPRQETVEAKKTTSNPVIVAAPGAGVPGRPGTGVLDARLGQVPIRRPRAQSGSVRPDLGTVFGTRRPGEEANQGTISSLLSGRKGGLL